MKIVGNYYSKNYGYNQAQNNSKSAPSLQNADNAKDSISFGEKSKRILSLLGKKVETQAKKVHKPVPVINARVSATKTGTTIPSNPISAKPKATNEDPNDINAWAVINSKE